MNGCPAREQLARLLAEQLGGAEARQIEAHVQTCARGQEALAALTGGNLICQVFPAERDRQEPIQRRTERP
jgi:hypothetical protein